MKGELTEAGDRGEIYREIAAGRELIEELEETVSSMKTRLSPILYGEPPTSEDKEQRKEGTPLGNELVSHNRRLSLLLHELRSINECIAL